MLVLLKNEHLACAVGERDYRCNMLYNIYLSFTLYHIAACTAIVVCVLY